MEPPRPTAVCPYCEDESGREKRFYPPGNMVVAVFRDGDTTVLSRDCLPGYSVAGAGYPVGIFEIGPPIPESEWPEKPKKKKRAVGAIADGEPANKREKKS